MRLKKLSFLLVLLFSFNLFGANSKNISNISKLNVSKKSFLNGPVKTYYKNGKIKSKEYYTGNKNCKSTSIDKSCPKILLIRNFFFSIFSPCKYTSYSNNKGNF